MLKFNSIQYKLILIVSYVINQFNVNGQSTIDITPNQQISNLTLLSILSYTSQSPININQTLLSSFTSSEPNSANTMMTTSTITTNLTRPPPLIGTNMTRPLLTLILTPPAIITTHITRSTTASTTTTPEEENCDDTSNFAKKCEQYITLLIAIHFLLFIFPIH